jgi:CheY-like chemotaxis protein
MSILSQNGVEATEADAGSRFTNSPATNIPATVCGAGRESLVREIVVVDPACGEYGEFVAAARRGEFGLHFCVDGRSAVRLAREFRADAWVVAGDLPDMSGLDLVGLLSRHVVQAEVDPLRPGARVSLSRLGRAKHSGIFLVCDSYRLEDEQQALASGVAGYLVRPLSLETIFLSPGVRS